MFVHLRMAYMALFLIAGVEFSLGATFGVMPLADYAAPYLSIGSLRQMVTAWVFPPLVWSGLVAVSISQRRVRRPTRSFVRILRRHREWLGRGFVFIMLIMPISSAFTSFKQAIPSIVPFYADPFLAEIDRAIFGVDPWRITHAIFGASLTLYFDRIYAVWFAVMMLMFSWFCFTRDQQFQVRGLLTYLGSWVVLGSLMAAGLSSVGPCFYQEFYGDDRYGELMATLHATDAQTELIALRAMSYLLDSEGKFSVGAGISAMPSLHVAIAWLLFLCTLGQSRRIVVKVFSGVYAASIFVGSVHLGWHYAADGIISIIVVSGLWIAFGRFVSWVHLHEHRSTPSAENPPAQVLT